MAKVPPSGRVTGEFGDAIYGSEAGYDPAVYLGRVSEGEALELVHGRVIHSEYNQQIIYVRGTEHTGWITLDKTTWADALWTGSERLSGAGEPVAIPEIDPQLLAQLVDDPDNRDALIVLGDVLVQAGDPRGELVALQDVCARNELLWHPPGTAAHEAGLVQRAAETSLRQAIAPAGPGASRAVWRLGQLRALDLYLKETEDSLLDELLHHPTTRFLVELYVHVTGTDPQPFIDVLERVPLPCALRRFGITSDRTGTLAGVWRRMPRLRRIAIVGPKLHHGRMDLPALRWLSLEQRPFADVAELGHGTLGALERIDWKGASASELGWLLGRGDLPALRRLVLTGCADLDRACTLFSDAIAGSLAELDLQGARITEEGAAQLDTDRWRLQILRLTGTDVPKPLRRSLEKRFHYVDWVRRKKSDAR
ncbi:MAG: hypothetical protein ABI867_10610 [Kofleriaceae bacterium]